MGSLGAVYLKNGQLLSFCLKAGLAISVYFLAVVIIWGSATQLYEILTFLYTATHAI